MPNKTVGYIEYSREENLINKIKTNILELANKNNFGKVNFVYETKLRDFYYTHWHDRKIFEVFNGLEAGDNLIINNFSSFSNSFFETFYIARQIINKGISLYSCKEETELDSYFLNKKILENLSINT